MSIDMFDKNVTNRGFKYWIFKDHYDEKCSVQESSLATEAAIWLGIDDGAPRIQASTVMAGATGWVKYPLPKDVKLTSRMHLTQEQVRELLPVLQHFADTGVLPD